MFLLLRLSAGSGLRPASQLFNELILDVDRQLYRDSLWWLSLPFLAAALAWILGRRRRPEVPMVLALLTGGTVLLVHTVLAAGGLRNGLMVGYALSLVAGLIVAERHQRLVRLVGFLTVVAFAISSVTASEATNERLDAEALSADTAAVRRTAAYLAGLPQEATVATTRAFAGMLAFESSRDLLLLPFGSGPTQLVDPTPEPERQRGWAGPVSGSWIGPVVAVMEARTETGFFGAGDINEFRVDQGVTHVVVSGNLADAASVTDGGFLLDLLVQSPNAEAVFRSSTEEFPQWLVVFEVTGRPLIAEQPPIVLDVLDDGAASYDEDQVSVDLLTYRNAVIESFVAIQP